MGIRIIQTIVGSRNGADASEGEKLMPMHWCLLYLCLYESYQKLRRFTEKINVPTKILGF